MLDDLEFHSGNPQMPVVVLVHGLGANKYFWRDPTRCSLVGGLAPLTVFLAEPPGDEERARLSIGRPAAEMKTFWQDLAAAGFSIVNWSQALPPAPVAEVSRELTAVFQRLREKWPAKPVFLLGHSRGGLIAKKFLLEGGSRQVAGLITIVTPHAGSRMADFSAYLSPAARFLEKVLPRESQAKMLTGLKRLAHFLKSPATLELRPGSALIGTLHRPLPPALPVLSIGATEPVLFRLYVRACLDCSWQAFSFPELLFKFIPARHRPAEIKPGEGDGLVTARSAVLAGGYHYDFALNHVGTAYDEAVQQVVTDFLHLAR